MRVQLLVMTLLFALASGCGGAPATSDTQTEPEVSETPKQVVSETPKQTPKQPQEEHPFAGSWAGTWAGAAKLDSSGGAKGVLKFKGDIGLTVAATGAVEGSLSGRASTLADYELSGKFTGSLSADGVFDGEYSFRGSRQNPHPFEGKLTLTPPDRAKGHLKAPEATVDQTPSVFKVTLERGAAEQSPHEPTTPTGGAADM